MATNGESSMIDLPKEVKRNTTATLIYQWMPVSQHGLKERLGVRKDAVTMAIRVLREHKLIYVTGYTSTKSYQAPSFDIGNKPDAEKLSSKQLEAARSAKYNKKPAVKVAKKKYLEMNKSARQKTIEKYYAANKTELIAKSSIRNRLQRESEKVKIPTTKWVGGNPFGGLRAVNSCSGADVAYVRVKQ
jgi:hypothetical protein